MPAAHLEERGITVGIRDILNKEIILFDGAMGTMLQQNGLKLGQNPEILNVQLAYLLHFKHFSSFSVSLTSPLPTPISAVTDFLRK